MNSNFSTMTWLKGSMFFQMAAFGAVELLPLYWRQDCGFSESQVGLISALGVFGAVVGPLAFGKLSERYALERPIRIGFLLYGITALSLFVWKTLSGQMLLYAALTIARWGFFTLVPVCVVATLAANGSERSGRDYGRYRRYGSCGYLLGVWCAGHFSDVGGFLLLFLWIAVHSGIAALPFFLRIKHPPRIERNAKSYLQLLKNKELCLLLLVEYFSSVMISAAFVFLPLRMNQLGASNTLTGTAIAACGVFALLSYSAVGRFVDRFDIPKLYVLLPAFSALRTITLALPTIDPHWFIGLQLLHVPTWVLSDVLRIKYLQHCVIESQRPKTQALILIVAYIGIATGSALGSGLLQFYSLQEMFVYHAFVPLLGLPFAMQLKKRGIIACAEARD